MELHRNVVGAGINLDRRGWRLLAGIAAMLLAVSIMAPASATSGPGPQLDADVQPRVEGGNPPCSDGLQELKIEPVEDGEFSQGDVTVEIDVTEGTFTDDDNVVWEGQVFSFNILSPHEAHEVIAKGGPDGNVYDYIDGPEDDGSGPGPVTEDETLHAPHNQDNRFYGLSHISFCVKEAQPELTIEKTAVADPISGGDHAAFNIQVDNVGAGVADNVMITDDLPNDVLSWEILSESGTDSVCSITDGNHLECNVGSLDPGGSFLVSAQTTDPIALTGSEKCNTTLSNTAIAGAGNHGDVEDSATIDVLCGSILIEKEYEVAPDTISEFTVFPLDDSGERVEDMAVVMDHTEVDATHLFCADQLGFGDYDVVETDTPENFTPAGDITLTVDSPSTCGHRLAADTVSPDAQIVNEAEPIELSVNKRKLSFNGETLVETDVPLAGFDFTVTSVEGTHSETVTTGDTGSATFPTRLEVGETYEVCETGVPDGEEGYWTDPDPVCETFTAELGQDESFTFHNAPRADVSVGFTDVTGFTSVTITCTDDEGTVLVEETFTSSDAVDLTQLDLGDYTCDIEVRNGSA